MASDDARIWAAAGYYEDAVSVGKPPTITVAKKLRVSRSTAGRLIAAARERRLLPPGHQGKATAKTLKGAHRPVSAEIRRGQPKARTVRLCDRCLVKWPCPEAARAR